MSANLGARILILLWTIAGGAVALTAGLHSRIAAPVWLILITCCGALLAGALGWLLTRHAWPFLRHAVGNSRRYITATALILGLLLAYAATPTLLYGPHLPERELVLTATGERDPAAQGSEVWFLGVYDASRHQPVPGTVTADPGWQHDGDRWVSPGDESATLRYRTRVTDALLLRCTAHPWSGILRFTWNGVAQEVSLYAETGGVREIPLSPLTLQAAPWTTLVYHFTVIVLHGLLIASALLVFIALLTRAWVDLVPLGGMLARCGQSVFGIGTAACVGYRVYADWLPHYLDDQLIASALAVAIGLLSGALAAWFAGHYVGHMLSARPRWIRVCWCLLAWAGGLLLVVAIPLERPVSPVAPVQNLRITATGQQNPDARGREIWVRSLTRANGNNVPLRSFAIDKGWELRDGAAFSNAAQPARLQWTGRASGDLTLEFVSHPWSGVIEIDWNGDTRRIDLFNEVTTTHTESLSVQPEAMQFVIGWRILSSLADACALGTLLLAISIWLATRQLPAPARPRRWEWAAYALVCASVWFFGLLVFWPGLMTADSMDQWTQITRGRLSDSHPAFHTLVNWGIVRVWESPAAIALSQILFGSIVVGWALSRMRTAGLQLWVAVATCALLAVSPVNAKLMITLWKDIPFSIALLVLIVMLWQVIVTNGAWLRQPYRWLALGVLAALATLLRHNGAPTAAAVFAMLFIVNVRQWHRLLLAGGVAAALFFGVRGPIYQFMGVSKVHSVSRYVQSATRPFFESRVQILAAHVVGGTPMSAEEIALLEEVTPLEKWAQLYNPCCMTKESSRKYMDDFGVYRRRTGEFAQLLERLYERNPVAIWRHYYWRTNYVWRVRFPEYKSYSTAIGIPRADGTVLTITHSGVKPDPTWPGFDYTYARFLEWLTADWRFNLNWRPAVHLWVLLAAVLVAAGAQRNWKILLLFVPIAVHSFFVAWLAPCHCFRYQYVVYLAALLLGPGLLLGGSKKVTRGRERGRGD